MIIALLLFAAAHARDIAPVFTLKSSGFVKDFVVDGDRLYAATDRGSVDVFDLNTRRIVHQILVEPITDYKDEPVAPIILSVDRFNGKTLFVSTGEDGYRNVWVHDGMHLKQVIGPKDKLTTKEARFIDDERMMFGTLAYEMILYNTGDNFQAYSRHVDQSAFADVELSEDRKTMVTSAESGEVSLIDVDSSKVIKVFSSENVDNVYRVAYRNGTVITAGQDRRVGVYPKHAKAYHIKSDFLVYCVGLSPSGKTGVYSSGVNSDLQVFDVTTGVKRDRLIGHFATLNAIRFINEKEFFSAGDERDIFFWRID